MARSFDNVDQKVAETEFFLGKLSGGNFAEVNFYLSAFASAARSITLTMQAVLGSEPRFATWYAARQSLLKASPLARYFVELRNYTQKTGATVVNRAVGGPAQAIGILSQMPTGLWLGESGEDMPPQPGVLVDETARAYFCLLLQVVYDCYVEFGPLIDPQQHYTPEHYASIGKTIEDAEEELGFPRGWTRLSGDAAELPYRFEAIRRHGGAGACTINELFEQYLGKRTPAPAPLPPWAPKDPSTHGQK